MHVDVGQGVNKQGQRVMVFWGDSAGLQQLGEKMIEASKSKDNEGVAARVIMENDLLSTEFEIMVESPNRPDYASRLRRQR